MNPMMLMQTMNNPKTFMMNQLNSNPFFKQAQQMTQGKSPSEIKQICQNICNQRGIDFDAALTQFQSQMPGLK